MKRIGWVIAMALPLLGRPLLANEEKGEQHQHESVTMRDLPAAVQDTLRKEAKGGKIEELRKETRGGEVIYEAEIVKDGKGTDVEVRSSGKVVERGTPHDESAEHERGEK